jgi:hypothetical protein
LAQALGAPRRPAIGPSGKAANQFHTVLATAGAEFLRRLPHNGVRLS